MPNLNEYLNGNLVLPERVKTVLNKYINEIIPKANEANTQAKQKPEQLVQKTDLGETAKIAWFEARDIALNNSENDMGLNNGLSYPVMGKVERERFLDHYYGNLREMDYSKLNFSCLSGEDDGYPLQNGLTQSENDVVTFFLHVILYENVEKKADDNPAYYRNRYDNFQNNTSYFKEKLNEEYLTLSRNGVAFYGFMKNGYSRNLDKANDQESVQLYQNTMDKNGPTGNMVETTQQQEIIDQIYAYKIARVNNTVIPEPTLKLHNNPKWDLTLIDKVIARFNGTGQCTDEECHLVEEMFNSITYFMNGKMDRPVDGDILSNIFIDGRPATTVFASEAPQVLQKADREAFYGAKILKALYSGEHYVETSIRYMGIDGKMKNQVMTFEPDLTLIAERERIEKHSWFRRTFFDWGPFAIKTCKTKQAKKKLANTVEKQLERRDQIESALKLCKNENEIYADNFKPNVLKSLNKANDVTLPDFAIWLDDKIKKNGKTHASITENVRVNTTRLLGNDEHSKIDELYILAASSIGVGKAIPLISNLSDFCEEGEEKTLITDSQMDQLRVQNVSLSVTYNTLKNADKNKIIDQSLAYYFKNGALNNPNGTVLLDVLQTISKNTKHEFMVENIVKLNKPTSELEAKCGELAKAYKDNSGAVISEEDLQFIQDKYIEHKIGQVFCQKLVDEVSKSDVNLYGNDNIHDPLMIFEQDNNDFTELVKSVKAEIKDSLFKSNKVGDILLDIYNNTNKIPERINTAIAKVADNHNNIIKPKAQEKAVEKKGPELKINVPQ